MESTENRKVMKTPKSVTVSLTGRCNLCCKYCFYADEMFELKELSTQEWVKVFYNLGRSKIMSVTLTGGEVFTRPDLFEIIDEIINNRMRYNILSNGTLINEKILSQFEQGKRRLRLDSIQISIDGSKAKIHNLSRPDSFDRALQGLKLLKNAGLPVVVRVTINRHNLHDLENIAYLLLEEIGLKSFSTNEALPMGAGCRNENVVSLTPDDHLIAMDKIKKLLKRYPGRLTAQAGPQARLRMYSEMELARKNGEKKARWKMGYLSSCGCVFSTLDILHDGTIVPCNMLPELVLGNILSDSLEDIWHLHPVIVAMRQRRDIPLKQVPGCENCEWASFCSGGCPSLAYKIYKDFNRADPHDCYRNFLSTVGESYALRD